MSPSACQKMLKTVCVVTTIVGLTMILSLISPLIIILDYFADLAHFPIDGAQSIDTDSEKLLLAISGGLMIGLCAFVWQITDTLFDSNPALAKRIITTSLLAWFVTDSLGSLFAGAWFNVIMNTMFLALFLYPLFSTRFQTASQSA